MMDSIKKQQLISVLLIRVEGMKADNAYCLMDNCYPKYLEGDFTAIADEVENIINTPGE